MRVADQPEKERPRERLLSEGPSVLSLRECLAVLLGSGPPQVGCLGLAQQILERMPEEQLFASIDGAGATVLSDLRGLGPAGRARLLAAFELARRFAAFEKEKKKKARASGIPGRAIAKIPLELRRASREWLGFVPVYSNGRVGAFCLVELGLRSHVHFDPTELFGRLLPLRSAGFFLFHNHPSGRLRPSRSDRDLTSWVARLSLDLGIQFGGHWIVGADAQEEVI